MGVRISISIPTAKLTSYLLDIHHPKGGSKARFFTGHGFSLDRPEEFAGALRAHLIDAATSISRTAHPDGYGIKIEARGPIATPAGRVLTIRSVWNRAEDTDLTVFVTAFPD